MDDTPAPAKRIKTEPVDKPGDVVVPDSLVLPTHYPLVRPKDAALPIPSPIPQSVIADQLLTCEQRQCDDLGMVPFSPPVRFIYNPLTYAKETHTCYVRCYGNSKKKVLFLGMNPGPFGMAQNGVPFGDTTMVRDWLRISGEVGRPHPQHPKRPITGLDCPKREVSGSRFWGLMSDLCTEPQTFFRNCYVHNYCPLCFMGESGKNITPPSLRVRERRPLEEVCDRALCEAVELLGVEWVVCVGRYVERRAKKVIKLADNGEGKHGSVTVCNIMHPSPINPLANRGWAECVRTQLTLFGLIDIVKGDSK